MTNRTVFFDRLDRVVRCGETNGSGLIPSLFWYHNCLHIDECLQELDRVGGGARSFLALELEMVSRRHLRSAGKR